MINILMPICGSGKRFADAGYKDPKPLIKVFDKPMVKHVIDNVFVKGSRFIFVFLSEFVNKYKSEITAVIPKNALIVEVDKPTEGAACSVLFAKEFINNTDELILCNCDQLIHDKHFMKDSIDFYRQQNADGGILCFLNSHAKWSYARFDSGIVTEVVEKKPISNLATVGIYYYKQGKYFVDAAEEMIKANDRVNNEFYVAPVYNYMIKKNLKIMPYMINNMHGLGTPEDLEKFDVSYISQR